MGAISLITSNLEVSLEMLLVILIVLGGILFYARDFKLGLVLHFLAFACNFLALWVLNEYNGYDFNIAPSLVLMILFFIFMAFSLFAVEKNAPTNNFT